MKKEKKLCVLHFICSFNVGGAEKMLVDILSHSHNICTVVIVLNDDYAPLLVETLRDNCRNVHMLLRRKKISTIFWPFKFLYLLWRYKVRIIHTHDTGAKNIALLSRLLFPWVKVVHTIHNTTQTSRLSSLDLFLIKHCVSLNICISQAVYAEFESIGLKNKVVVYDGIDLQKFQKQATRIFDPKNVRLVNVGRLFLRQKGQDILIKAVAECRKRGLNVTLDLIGGAYNYDKQSLPQIKELIHAKGLNNYIRLLGHQDDIAVLLPEYDIFILPSRYEGFGLVVIEAFAAGLPVIASDIDGPKEIIRPNYDGLLFAKENEFDLVDKITMFIQDEELRQKIYSNLPDVAIRFDIRKTCKEYVKAYKQLLS